METFCGTVDFSSRTTDFCAVVRMWKSLAPLCRGYSYTRGGISLMCERGKNISATRPSPSSSSKRENATVILSAAPKNPLLATELITRYICGGLESLCEAERDVAFALVDEGERLFAIFSAESTIFWARLNQKILFSTSRDSISAYFGENVVPPTLCLSEIAPHGKALFCDVKGDFKFCKPKVSTFR